MAVARQPRSESAATVDFIAKCSGEAASVVKETLTRYEKWFKGPPGELVLSDAGWKALGMELVGRGAHADGPGVDRDSEAAFEHYLRLIEHRPAAESGLDQVFATPQSVMRRAALLIEQGEVQRGLLFLGDDDLTSLALYGLGVRRTIKVIDVDQRVLDFVESSEASQVVQTCHHDLRRALPASIAGRQGAVFLDPPYAVEGFRLFLNRAIDALKDNGRAYVAFGASRRASERGLAKQRLIMESQFYVEAVKEQFHAYDGAESIGSRSDLWILRKVAQTKRAGKDSYDERALYSGK